MLTTLFAYVLIGLFLATENYMRRGQKARTLHTGPFDRGSTRLLGVAFLTGVLALLLAPVLNYFEIGCVVHDAFTGWSGVIIMVIGLVVRFWANKSLGAFYTRTLLITEDQGVVERGPYRVVRHPGYLGVLLMWVGAGLATVNWMVATIVLSMMLAAYRYRIQSEETMLVTTFGEQYKEYMARTWKLIPFLY